MKTATKLCLGFGTITLLGLISCLIIFAQVLSLRTGVDALTGVARNRSVATREMKADFAHYALSLRTYLQTGERRYLDEAATARSSLEGYFEQYQRLAVTEQQHRMVKNFAELWRSYLSLSEPWVARGDKLGREDSLRLADVRSQLIALLDQEMKTDSTARFDVRRDTVLASLRATSGLALVLVVIVGVLSVVTGITVGRRVLRTEARLRQVDQYREEFLATLAHELRNPLVPIRNGIHLLGSAPASEKAGRLLAMMDRQCGHLVRLIDDLLDLARISSGRLELRRAVIDLHTVIAHSVEISGPAMAAAGHDLRLELPPPPLPIYGDLTRLAQALGNLLNNAAKYTPPGGVITLRVHATEDEVTIVVSDNGQGIPPDKLEEVFEMFTQLDRSPAARQGMGIGLALVRNIVRLHGGRISAASRGAKLGSTFTMRLPRLAPMTQ